MGVGPGPAQLLPRAELQRLLDALRTRGYRVLGPVPRDGAVVFDEIREVAELPCGLREAQQPGRYRIEPNHRDTFFDVVNGPGSLKPYVFAPREELLQIEPEGRSFRAHETLPNTAKLAVVGVRACDLAALAVQDRVFLEGPYPDAHYAARRQQLFLIAVNCTRCASTCFCVSMGTGPEAKQGFDLVLTEQEQGLLVRAGSPTGEEVLRALSLDQAPAEALARERTGLESCAASMERSLETSDLPGMLYRNLEHPRWKDVGARCLSCGNCTMVCPTCFCHDERDEPFLGPPDEAGVRSVRVREWDSCFNRDHAQVYGTNFRPQIEDRYRQWLVHKLGSWIDQFGTSGCVGCGRCITWCPVGIDLTEEVRALREPVP
jgi:ferredoxin